MRKVPYVVVHAPKNQRTSGNSSFFLSPSSLLAISSRARIDAPRWQIMRRAAHAPPREKQTSREKRRARATIIRTRASFRKLMHAERRGRKADGRLGRETRARVMTGRRQVFAGLPVFALLLERCSSRDNRHVYTRAGKAISLMCVARLANVVIVFICGIMR